MSVHNPYTAGCIDCNGCRIKNENPYFYDKDRVFDPTNVPRYANNLGLPALLLKENPLRGITHLHVGPDFAGVHSHDGLNCADQDTVVMEVGAREMNGKTACARWFGELSEFNRQSFASDKSVESIDAQILKTTCIGKLLHTFSADQSELLNRYEHSPWHP